MSTQQMVQAPEQSREERATQRSRLVRRLHANNNVATSILWVIATIVVVIFIGVIAYLLVKGLAYIIDPAFYNTSSAGIGREIFNTFYILILAEVISIPIALAAAIYLIEYAHGGWLVTSVHFAAETLAGVPSIVLGLFGFLVFSSYTHFGFSRIAGILTLICLNFPLALRLFEDVLSSVPIELREGGLALGATKWRVIHTVVLPSALSGIVTAVILTAGKIIGEAAALLFTMGLTNPTNVFTLNPLLSTDTLTTHLYFITGPGAGSGERALRGARCVRSQRDGRAVHHFGDQRGGARAHRPVTARSGVAGPSSARAARPPAGRYQGTPSVGRFSAEPPTDAQLPRDADPLARHRSGQSLSDRKARRGGLQSRGRAGRRDAGRASRYRDRERPTL